MFNLLHIFVAQKQHNTYYENNVHTPSSLPTGCHRHGNHHGADSQRTDTLRLLPPMLRAPRQRSGGGAHQHRQRARLVAIPPHRPLGNNLRGHAWQQGHRAPHCQRPHLHYGPQPQQQEGDILRPSHLSQGLQSRRRARRPRARRFSGGSHRRFSGGFRPRLLDAPRRRTHGLHRHPPHAPRLAHRRPGAPRGLRGQRRHHGRPRRRRAHGDSTEVGPHQQPRQQPERPHLAYHLRGHHPRRAQPLARQPRA